MKALVIGIGRVGALVAHAGAPALINPGTPDAAIVIFDPALGRAHPTQLQHLTCIGNPEAVWFEDFWPIADQAHDPGCTRHGNPRRTALHPTGLTFVGHIEATQDR